MPISSVASARKAARAGVLLTPVDWHGPSSHAHRALLGSLSLSDSPSRNNGRLHQLLPMVPFLAVALSQRFRLVCTPPGQLSD
jgi:hypothetical protein